MTASLVWRNSTRPVITSAVCRRQYKISKNHQSCMEKTVQIVYVESSPRPVVIGMWRKQYKTRDHQSYMEKTVQDQWSRAQYAGDSTRSVKITSPVSRKQYKSFMERRSTRPVIISPVWRKEYKTSGHQPCLEKSVTDYRPPVLYGEKSTRPVITSPVSVYGEVTSPGHQPCWRTTFFFTLFHFGFTLFLPSTRVGKTLFPYPPSGLYW